MSKITHPSSLTLPAHSVTVVVAVYNDEKHIAACIDSLLSQNYENYRILVVDDGSRDGTRAVVQSKFPQVELISHTTNQGAPAARNTGIRNSDAEIIAFIDADARAPIHWLLTLTAPFSDQSVGASSGPDKAPPEDSDFAHSVDFTMRSWLATGHVRMGSPLARLSLIGCNMAVRSTVFAEVGLFDERLRYRGEEKELSQRIRRHGHKMVYIPEVEILHHRRDAYSSFWRQNYNSGRARYEILAAAPDALEPAHLFPAVLMLFVGVCLLASLAVESLLLVPGSYLLLLLLNGVIGGFRQRNWKAVLRVSVLTAYIHLGYGSGLIIRTLQAVLLRQRLQLSPDPPLK